MNRTEAIEKVKDMRDFIIREHSPNDVFVSHMNEAIKVLSEERPHGEWEQIGEMTYKCTRCGWLKKIGLMPYCENCGADMRKRDDSE